ncbi:MAG: hypothetical protein JXA03_05840 [Bacteroidales bacterium]|nr:hypothetical protein [Bacteroidales bacterium]
MRIISMILLFLLSGTFSFSQSDSLEFNKKAKDRFVIWLIPSASKNIYGISIGPVGSEAICNRPYTKYSHGLNLQIPGQGFFQTFYINKMKFKDFHANEISDSLILQDTLPKKAIHNGLIISPLGTFTDQVNGISFSLWMSMGEKINGLSFNFLWNLYEQINGISIGLVNHAALTKGVQIGLVNKTIKLKGFQFGLWNKNETRSLPIINWNFKVK